MADACKLAARLRTEIEADRNPALILKPAAEPAAKTFKEYAAELVASKQTALRNGKHQAQWPSTLAAYVYPHIGDKRPGAPICKPS